jgi:virginiamycin A acetyltransferase
MTPIPADPTALHPIPGQPRVVLLKPLVTSPLIEVGEYSYYDDPDDPTAFETRSGSWAEHFDLLGNHPTPRDTIVGNDVWFGYHSMIMPGRHVGHGAIIASGAVVVDDVPDYGIVGGNPARLIRTRYSDAEIARLLALAWWDWPVDHLTEHIRAVMTGTVDDLEGIAPRR